MFYKYKIFWLIGALLCFTIIPAMLLNEVLSGVIDIRYQNEVEDVFDKMDENLNLMERFSNNAHYFHLLFKNIFEKAAVSQTPFNSIENGIKKLKKTLPNEIQIVVWDKNGQTVNQLTDIKKYRYFLAKLHNYLKTTAETFKEEGTDSSAALEFIETDIKTFRPLLGKFIQAKDFKLPFLPEEQGKCIIADSKNDFQLVWFNSNEQFTMLCFIKPLEPPRTPGIERTINVLNSRNNKIETGVIDINDFIEISENSTSRKTKELLIELAKYENSAFSHRITNDRLMAFRLLTPNLRGYCIMNKEDMQMGYPVRRKNELLTKIAAAILLFMLLYYCYKLVDNKNFVSIRTRIALLFLYANGLPLLILCTIGYEHLQQYEKLILRETHKNNEKLLREIDTGLADHEKRLSKKALTEFETVFKNTKYRLPNESDRDELERLLKTLDAEEINVYDKKGNAVISCKTDEKNITPHEAMKFFTLSTLTLFSLNEESGEQMKNEEGLGNLQKNSFWGSVINFDKFNSSILQYATDLVGKPVVFNHGSSKSLYMAYILGNKENRNFNSILFVFWSMEKFQNSYLQTTFNERKKERKAISSNIEFFAMSIKEKKLIGYNGNNPENIVSAVNKTANTQAIHENNIVINGEKTILTALSGSLTDHMILCAALPAQVINKKIDTLKLNIGLLALLNFIIVTAVIIALNRQFIIPVHQLYYTVNQINSQNYEHKTTISNNDEFGQLGVVFNQTTEGLSELAVGKIVQEALLPDSRHKSNGMEIFGKSVTMTKLGGDYFDYFPISDSLTGVLMGDVAGHGIPAAIIMAVAKATIILNKNLAENPADILQALHNTLYTLKKNNLKRMLTCQFITVNDVNGDCIISNSGHCYPAVISDKGRESYFIETIGTPLGITKNLKCNNHNFKLKPKDTMILYSDCLIEAVNSKNEAFGSKRLLRSLKECWSEDLETYYKNIFNMNRAWSKTIDDDTTILLIRFNPEESKGGLDIV